MLKTRTREALLAYLPAAAWAAAALLLLATGGSLATALLLGAGALGLGAAGWTRRSWVPLAQLLAGGTAALLAVFAPDGPALPLFAAAVALGVVAAQLARGRQRLRALDEEQRALRRQVDRRINEIFSLQELSYVLAESLSSERITAQVARYVLRFLHATGAAVLLAEDPRPGLRVAAADGSLEGWAGRTLTGDEACLALQALANERIEVAHGTEPEPVFLLPGQQVMSGLAAPLRAHGLALGVLVVADRRSGSFSPEDLWLLSTVATHVSVVLANSRLFELVGRAKEEWETAFNAITEGIAVVDAGGRIARGNHALATLLGMELGDLLGYPFWHLVMGATEGEDALLGAARRGETARPRELQSAALDRMLRLTAAPMAEPTPDAAVVVLVEDVTEQRSLESQLIQSERLAAVGQLVSGVAHELNNPLTSIAGLSEFLQERPGLGRAEREHLTVIHDQAERAGRIVRNLLTFARRGIPGEEPVDLNDLVDRTALLVRYELSVRGITLAEDRTGAPLRVRGNADELQQVLLNLVTNAAQAVRDLPPGTPREIRLQTRIEGTDAVVLVRDSGPGVPEAIASQIFTPFFTTKEPGEGTGLGLSLSYRIVESHGGRLRYQAPAPGERGAVFSFSLPLAEGAAPPEPAPMARRELLLVDGDPAAELIVRALFEPAGYAVRVARTAAEGAAELSAGRWGVALVDGALSADGSRRLIDALEPGAGQRVLVATAEPAVQRRARERGFDVLPRPFLPRDVVAKAGDLLPVPAADQGEVAR